MDFDFSPEQVMIRDLARDLLAKQCPPQVVRQMMDDPVGHSEGLWQEMAGIGRFGWVSDPEGNRIELWQPA